MRSRLERLLRMAEEVRRGTFPNVDTFCQMFEVKPRTVYGDLRELKESAGLAIEFDRLRKGYYTSDANSRLPVFDLTGAEILVLVVAAEMLAGRAGGAFEQISRGALAKILARIAGRVREHIERIRGAIRSRQPESKSLSWSAFSDLVSACGNANITEIVACDKEGVERTITVHPYLYLCDGCELLLLFRCAETGHFYYLPHERIRSCKVSRVRFERVQEVDAAAASTSVW
jgi:predicted DNA-binding transcriptional regulator YafY